MIDLEKQDGINSTELQEQVPDKDNNSSSSSYIQETDDDDLEPKPGDEDIHGWLVFFLFTVGLGGLLTLVQNIVDIKMENYANYLLVASDVLTCVGVFFLACYTVYSFLMKKPNAVFLGKSYLILIFLGNALSLLTGIGEEGRELGSTYQMAKSLIWGIVWFIYLMESKQVEEIFPCDYRKVAAKDWVVVISVILIPVVCFILGLATIGLGSFAETPSAGLSDTKSTYGVYENSNANKNIFTTSDCSTEEVTDGRVVFVKPQGFTSPDTLAYIDEATPVYQYSDSHSEITLCSGWEENFNKATFEQYWNGWKNETFDSYEVRVKTNEPIEVNGNEGYCKIVNVSGINFYINWEFILLHNSNTDKVFLLSYYTNQKPSSKLVYSILNSVRFEK